MIPITQSYKFPDPCVGIIYDHSPIPLLAPAKQLDRSQDLLLHHNAHARVMRTAGPNAQGMIALAVGDWLRGIQDSFFEVSTWL